LSQNEVKYINQTQPMTHTANHRWHSTRRGHKNHRKTCPDAQNMLIAQKTPSSLLAEAIQLTLLATQHNNNQ